MSVKTMKPPINRCNPVRPAGASSAMQHTSHPPALVFGKPILTGVRRTSAAAEDAKNSYAGGTPCLSGTANTLARRFSPTVRRASRNGPAARPAAAWVGTNSPYNSESPCIGRGTSGKTSGCAASTDAHTYCAHRAAATLTAARSTPGISITSSGRRLGATAPGQAANHRWP